MPISNTVFEYQRELGATMEDQALLSQGRCLLVKETLREATSDGHFKPPTHQHFLPKPML